MNQYLSKRNLSLFLACISAFNNLFANDSTDSLLDLSFEELTQVKVIIASGIEQNIKKAPATVSLITAEDIKKTGATNLVDILESVPGIHIQYDSFGFRPLISIRGGSSHQTLLMVDGNPLKDLVWSFGMFWKGLPANIIERIEVIRGPGSALYGADASAGVINVITKTAAQTITNEVAIQLGSFDSQSVWLQSSGKIKNYQTGFSANLASTDGHNPHITSDLSGSSGNTNYGSDNADIRFSVANGNWQLLGDYIRHKNIETGMTGAGFFDPVTKASDERFDVDLIYKSQYSKNTEINSKLHYQDLNYSSEEGFRESPPSTSYPSGKLNYMSSSERQYSLEFSALHTGFDNHKLRLGVGYKHQDIYKVKQVVNYLDINGNSLATVGPLTDISNTPFAFAPETSRKIGFIFIQDAWEFSKDWELTLGLRHDDYSDFGQTTNPRLALTWEISPNLSTKFLYGQAFRAPSFQELYSNTSRAKANSNLKPEKSETVEFGFSYAFSKNLQTGISLYSFNNSESIARDQNRQYQNTGEYKNEGIELEANWLVNKNIQVSANYSYRQPPNNSFRTFKLPEQEAYLRIDWQMQQDIAWNLQSNWVATRVRKDNDSRANLADYLLTDTTIRYTGLKQIELALSIRNLFDEDAKEPTGTSINDDLPLPERNFYIEVSYKF